MKETLKITDEAYRSDMERLWRYVKRLRDTTRYRNVTFTLQHWMLSCDGLQEKTGTSAGIDLTPLFSKLSLQPTNSEIIAVMKAAGADVDVELPVLLTFTLDVDYTVID